MNYDTSEAYPHLSNGRHRLASSDHRCDMRTEAGQTKSWDDGSDLFFEHRAHRALYSAGPSSVCIF
jgi:hypothetical protein